MLFATLILCFLTAATIAQNVVDKQQKSPDTRELQETPEWVFPGYPDQGPVIAVLVSSRPQDVEELTTALRSLVFLKGDDPDFPAPVLVFNEGDLSEEQVQSIKASTTRPMAFPNVDFSVFPSGWNHETESRMFRVKGRQEWGYYQMIRFWITGIWKHPALGPYGTVMRIDSDSCFKDFNDHLPNLKNENLVYHSQYVGYEDGLEYTTGLIEFTENFMQRTNKAPGNPFMWHFIKATWAAHKTLPVFMTNFEVTKKAFMLRPDVIDWHDSLTEGEPFGIFRYRWGDAVTRFLTAAIFTTNERVMTSRPVGYGHKQQCLKEEVEQALNKIQQ
mmetsp:Transcript_13126/g.16579  ORF Transcript_13126/g.16579 Transcript_13126/m.16579 type:complete len:331 (+) Transcript_13126:193-1185(+)|eukprot:CAMPEP_0172502074 /NCGR_PEP_ID=MMETSP1066-20121228/156260_1 /TAXON_ID=671091 /ORGANISM="Coscinodiscus wailesii, Strain CCMP2513" /LENGTH=330 /DNA_ID=CAMNT_0013277185 /DNA_START=151 /DNA_END=1143 /DNA_ORIENTATION=-